MYIGTSKLVEDIIGRSFVRIRWIDNLDNLDIRVYIYIYDLRSLYIIDEIIQVIRDGMNGILVKIHARSSLPTVVVSLKDTKGSNVLQILTVQVNKVTSID